MLQAQPNNYLVSTHAITVRRAESENDFLRENRLKRDPMHDLNPVKGAIQCINILIACSTVSPPSADARPLEVVNSALG